MDEKREAVRHAYYGVKLDMPSQPAPALPVANEVSSNGDPDEPTHASYDFDSMSLRDLRKFITDHDLSDDVDLNDPEFGGKLSLQRLAVEEAYASVADEDSGSGSDDDEDMEW